MVGDYFLKEFLNTKINRVKMSTTQSMVGNYILEEFIYRYTECKMSDVYVLQAICVTMHYT